MRKMTFGVLVLIFVLMMVGCAKPPEQAIAAAKQAITTATEAGAGEYASDSLKAAEEQQAALDAELKVQEEKFALFRSYKKAEDLANQVKAAGEKAAQDAATRKEQVKQEATALINEAKTQLATTKEALAKAPRGKGAAADLKMMENDLATAETSITEAETALTGERFNEAKSKAEAVKSSIANVQAQIDAAIAAKGGKK